MNEPVPTTPSGSGANPWALNPRNLFLIAGIAFAALGLLALTTAIDLPTTDAAERQREEAAEQRRQDAAEQRRQEAERRQQQGGSAFGGDSGSIDLGAGSSVEIQPIPGCPGGFAIGNVLVVPDPEACGFRRVPPGATGFDPDGRIILVPSEDGNIGGLRLGPDSSVELLPPGQVGRGGSDFFIGQAPDGSFGLIRPDGSEVQIVPGDDGLSFRDRGSGNSEFIPAPDGSGDVFGDDFSGEDPLDLSPPGSDEPDDRQDPSQPFDNQDNDDSDDGPTDWSAYGPVLLALAAIALLIALFFGVRNFERDRPTDEDDEDVQDDLADAAIDYSVEISALDRLLWEIEQEPDPRTAIRRVYAALETGLGNPSMARKRSETPGIYLRRILGRFETLEGPLAELTGLFEQARFSEHEISPDMRNRAVSLLLSVRGQFASATGRAESPPMMTVQ